jgi:hypothetical protein
MHLLVLILIYSAKESLSPKSVNVKAKQHCSRHVKKKEHACQLVTSEYLGTCDRVLSTHYEHQATTGQATLVYFNFLPSTIPTWPAYEVGTTLLSTDQQKTPLAINAHALDLWKNKELLLVTFCTPTLLRSTGR